MQAPLSLQVSLGLLFGGTQMIFTQLLFQTAKSAPPTTRSPGKAKPGIYEENNNSMTPFLNSMMMIQKKQEKESKLKFRITNFLARDHEYSPVNFLRFLLRENIPPDMNAMDFL